MSNDPQSNHGQLSAKMMAAQAYFQKVVKHELQVLVSSGLEREVAVKVLLHRIVESTDEPDEMDVKRVMRQFQMNYDDAVRALIVKQEIGRLKRQGLDAFAAIEELTRKMHGISVPAGGKQSDEEEKENMDDGLNESMEDPATSDHDSQRNDTTTSTSTPAPTEDQDQTTEEVAATDESVDNTMETTSANPEETAAVDAVAPATTPETPQKETEDSTYLSSLSLCQRIDQVSISASSPEAVAATTSSTSPPGSPSSSLSTTRASDTATAFTLFSSTSRKRRVTSEPSSPNHETEDEPASPHATTLPSSSSSAHRPHFAMARPMSPTFRFPKNKKQKIWTDDEDSEPFFDSVAFKTSSILPPASPTAVSTNSETPTASNTATPSKMGKRRRSVRSTGSISSPELDEIDVEDSMVRVTKRHKL